MSGKKTRKPDYGTTKKIDGTEHVYIPDGQGGGKFVPNEELNSIASGSGVEDGEEVIDDVVLEEPFVDDDGNAHGAKAEIQRIVRNGTPRIQLQKFSFFEGRNEDEPTWHRLRNPIKFYDEETYRAFYDLMKNGLLIKHAEGFLPEESSR